MEYLNSNMLKNLKDVLDEMPEELKNLSIKIANYIPYDLMDDYNSLKKDIIKFVLNIRDLECEKCFKLGVAFGVDVEKAKHETQNIFKTGIQESKE